MWSMLTRLREKFLPSIPPRTVRRASWYFRPHLEALEDRLVPDAVTFTGGGNGTSWNDPDNWVDLNNGANVVPGASDDASILIAATVVISGAAANVNSLVTLPGSVLTVTAGNQLTINNNVPGTTSSPLAGSVIDLGRIVANTSDPLNGTGVVFGGGAVIGPGDLNGNLDAGPNSSITFAPTNTGEFVAGATFGLGTGNIIIAGPVQVDGTLDDNTATLNVVTGGTLMSAPGSTAGAVNENATCNWTGGFIALAGGFNVGSSGSLTASGPDTKYLAGPLSNQSAFTSLGGAGPLFLASSTASISNVVGHMTLSLPLIAGVVGSGGISNSPLGTLEAAPPDGAPNHPLPVHQQRQSDSGRRRQSDAGGRHRPKRRFDGGPGWRDAVDGQPDSARSDRFADGVRGGRRPRLHRGRRPPCR